MAKQIELSGMNIYQRLAAVRKGVEVIQKNASGYGYKYVSEDEIMSKLSVYLERYHLSLIPAIKPGTMTVSPYHYVKTKNLKNGGSYEEHVNEIMATAEMTYTWVNNDSPEEVVVVPWYMVGQQSDASQAFGSGLTYCNRYFLLKYFNIATPDEDPDNFRSKQKETAAAEDTAIAVEIIAQVDSYIREYLAANPSDKTKVGAVVKKYVKDGNYNKIKQSALAAKLLEEIMNTFKNEKEN